MRGSFTRGPYLPFASFRSFTSFPFIRVKTGIIRSAVNCRPGQAATLDSTPLPTRHGYLHKIAIDSNPGWASSGPVPEGLPIIAQRFNVGFGRRNRPSPVGTAELATSVSAVPPGQPYTRFHSHARFASPWPLFALFVLFVPSPPPSVKTNMRRMIGDRLTCASSAWPAQDHSAKPRGFLSAALRYHWASLISEPRV